MQSTSADVRRRARAKVSMSVLVVSVAAIACGFAPAGGATGPARGTATTATAPARVASGIDRLLRPAATSAGDTQPTVAADVQPADTPPPGRPAMSMDDPIQGGLTAHQAQRRAAAVTAAHRDAAQAATYWRWTPEMGRTALERARSWLGMPYSWAGGDASGPSSGRCVRGSGADLDCHIRGFDCSGLVMYAWGPYVSLPHLAESQVAAGHFRPTLEQLQPGDLVFFAAYLPDGIGHVAVYDGHGMVIEAPQSGGVVRRSPLSRLIAEDGYRGAVRPMTAPTPTLSAPARPVRAGSVVTLRGAHLDGVGALQVDGHDVPGVAKHGTTALTFRAPKHGTGTARVTVETPWGATSKPVPLTYGSPHRAPHPKRSAPAHPKPPAASSKPPNPPKPTSPKPTSPKPTSPKPTSPKPTSPKPTSPAPSGPTSPSPAPSSSAPGPSLPPLLPAPSPSSPG